MTNKEYIVCLSVSFDTPVDVKASSKDAAAQKAKAQFKKLFDEFKEEKLNDIANFNIDIDYVECQET